MTSTALDRLFVKLQYKETQLKAASGLRDLELTKSDVDQCYKLISSLASSSNTTHIHGALLAIESILEAQFQLDFDQESCILLTTRFANVSRQVLGSTKSSVFPFASEILAKLILTADSVLTQEFVDFEIKKALEWLQSSEKDLRHKYPAILILDQLCINCFTYLLTYSQEIFDLLLLFLSTKRVEDKIQQAAFNAFKSFLSMIVTHQRKIPASWSKRLYIVIGRRLEPNSSADEIYVSLLILSAAMSQRGIVDWKFSEISSFVFRFKGWKDVRVRRVIIELLPKLASLGSPFIRQGLEESMYFLLTLVRDHPLHQSDALISIGKIAIVIQNTTRQNIHPYLDEVFCQVKFILSSSKSKKRPEATNDGTFEAIGMIAQAVGPTLLKYSRGLVDMMFTADGLTHSLYTCLVQLTKYVPTLRSEVQERLLEEVAWVLCQKSYADVLLASSETKEFIVERDPGMVILALEILADFDFGKKRLVELVLACTHYYAAYNNFEIRRQALASSIKVLKKDNATSEICPNSVKIVTIIVERIVSSSISDTDPFIREVVLTNLGHSNIDHHLSQSEVVRVLTMALNDEWSSNRELALVLVGRLSVLNPAIVMPALRRCLIKVMNRLTFASKTSHKESSARLLFHLLTNLHSSLIIPYVDPIFDALIPFAVSSSNSLASKILNLLGELVRICSADKSIRLSHHIKTMMPVVFDTLADKSSTSKRQAALKVLKSVLSSGRIRHEDYPNICEILVEILVVEQSKAIRLEAACTLGTLGAKDPYSLMNTNVQVAVNNIPETSEKYSSSDDKYYPRATIFALARMLRDSSLANHHFAVVQSLLALLKINGFICIQFLPQIIAPIFSIMRKSKAKVLEFYLQQLNLLVNIMQMHMTAHIDEMLAIIEYSWAMSENLWLPSLSLLESLALELDLSQHVPRVLKMILEVFYSDRDDRHITKVIDILVTCGIHLADYLSLIIPDLVKLLSISSIPLKIATIESIGKLSLDVDLADFMPLICHAMVKIFEESQVRALHNAATSALCLFASQNSQDFACFIPIVSNVMNSEDASRIESIATEGVDSKTRNFIKILRNVHYKDTTTIIANAASKILTINQYLVKRIWQIPTRATIRPYDWIEWEKRLSIGLFVHSSSSSLRACADLVSVFYPLAKELFNYSFLSVWRGLNDENRAELVKCIEAALSSPTIPPDISQSFLNLVEFLERENMPLPISISELTIFASKSLAFAKALHYKETEFLSNSKSSEIIDSLISMYFNLQNSDAALGVLTVAQDTNIELKSTWYEKLQQWDHGMEAYQNKLEANPNDRGSIAGKFRCLMNLGELDAIIDNIVPWLNSPLLGALAHVGANVSWSKGRWDIFSKCIDALNPSSPDSAFFNAVLAIQQDKFQLGQKYIDSTREMLTTEVTALLGESYSRAYNCIVRLQMLVELEEVVQYKLMPGQPNKQALIRNQWDYRLKSCQRNVEVWQRILKVRSLVMPMKEDKATWIKYSHLCRKSGLMKVATQTLLSLLESGVPSFDEMNMVENDPKVVYAILKHQWEMGARAGAYESMRGFTKVLSESLSITTFHDIQPVAGDASPLMKLLSKCYLKIGNWNVELHEDWNETSVPSVLRSYLAATRCDPKSYKAYHAWALSNLEVVQHYERGGKEIAQNIFNSHVISSLKGFFRAISLSPYGSSLQDTLRLLSTWLKYGDRNEIKSDSGEIIMEVSVDSWLQVIPQLIARIDTPSQHIRSLIHQVLNNIGKHHPQALVYSIAVASKSENPAVKTPAMAILENIKTHSPRLVENALIVGEELIRVAVVWHETVMDGLGEALNMYLGKKNNADTLQKSSSFMNIFDDIRKTLKQSADTPQEMSFLDQFGTRISEAFEHVDKYKVSKATDDIESAIKILKGIYSELSKMLPTMTVLELEFVSPRLASIKDLNLAVPGTYKHSESVVSISSFSPTLKVMSSKQRPRRLGILGSDGKLYQYLLKGHEDLRLDERVMQLFGLVNSLLLKDPYTFERRLNITKYSVIPLSHFTGLIGWVPNCDTLHDLIVNYRDERKILRSMEQRLLLKLAPQYDKLTVMQKVEIFEHVQSRTTGQDLQKVLWLKSKSSEIWQQRRKTFARSLAVMSIVGYILGLGDRHPSNLMLDRVSGQVVHIDFGDCFEISMHREKFPEMVPFRLTRMLIKAMEVSGVEGTYRITCEHVMRVMRGNKDSVMAVLEAFIYDPLVSWRLLADNEILSSQETDPGDESSSNESIDEIPRKDIVSLSRSVVPHSRKSFWEKNHYEESYNDSEASNSKAVEVVDRISSKLTGKDFDKSGVDYREQVDLLIKEATSVENLCQLFIGWCAIW